MRIMRRFASNASRSICAVNSPGSQTISKDSPTSAACAWKSSLKVWHRSTRCYAAARSTIWSSMRCDMARAIRSYACAAPRMKKAPPWWSKTMANRFRNRNWTVCSIASIARTRRAANSPNRADWGLRSSGRSCICMAARREWCVRCRTWCASNCIFHARDSAPRLGLRSRWPFRFQSRRAAYAASDLLQIRGFQHEVARVHLAVHFVIAADETNALHFSAHFQRDRRAFHFQVLDQHHGVAVGERVAVGVLDDAFVAVVSGRGGVHRPLVRAIRADVVLAVRVSVFHCALRAGGNCRHDVLSRPRLAADDFKAREYSRRAPGGTQSAWASRTPRSRKRVMPIR